MRHTRFLWKHPALFLQVALPPTACVTVGYQVIFTRLWPAASAWVPFLWREGGKTQKKWPVDRSVPTCYSGPNKRPVVRTVILYTTIKTQVGSVDGCGWGRGELFRASWWDFLHRCVNLRGSLQQRQTSTDVGDDDLYSPSDTTTWLFFPWTGDAGEGAAANFSKWANMLLK